MEQERVSVGWSVHWSVRWSVRMYVRLLLFEILGGTYAVYTALFLFVSA